jgi:hypothetical protein
MMSSSTRGARSPYVASQLFLLVKGVDAQSSNPFFLKEAIASGIARRSVTQ